MIYLILLTDVALSCLLLWLIIRYTRPTVQPQAIINAEIDRLLEVDPLDWNDITLDGHERALA